MEGISKIIWKCKKFENGKFRIRWQINVGWNTGVQIFSFILVKCYCLLAKMRKVGNISFKYIIDSCEE